MIATLVGAICLLTTPAFGATDERSEVLSISPPRLISAVDAGTEYRTTVIFRNLTDETFTAYFDARDLVPAEDGVGFATLANGRTVAGWARLPFRSQLVRPDQRLELPIRIRIPADTPPGSHALGIVASRVIAEPGSNTDGEARVTVSASVVSQLVLTVSGGARYDVAVGKLRAPRLVWPGDDVRFRATVHNRGNVLARITQARVGVGAFTGQAERQLQIQDVDVLPAGKRRLETRWQERPLLGWFRPSVFLNVDGKQVRKEYPTVYVLPPWWLMALIAAALLLPVWGRVRRQRRFRRAVEEHADPSDPSDPDQS